MRVTLRQLEAFATVAKLSSVTAAAERMGLSQPAVSSLLRELERACGDIPLLDRSKRVIRLTEAGRETLRRAELILGETATLIEELRGLQEGHVGSVSLACTAAVASSILPKMLRQFRAHYPRWRFVIHDILPQDLVDTVLNGSADFGIGTVASHPDLDSVRLSSDVVSLVVPAQSALADRKSLRWDELVGLPTIAMRKSNVVRPILDGILAAHGTDFQPLIEVSLLSTALALASEGQGYAILPAFLIPEQLRAGLSVVPLTDPIIERPLSLFSRKGRVLSPAAERFHEIVSKTFEGS